ncbi:hypothetical protein BDZ94DRAFT_552645 [Collybia nuda]|uniref:Uncharacterized protein n=1 Tax=Collybia nuda TaxID=64659 RepID=A0A9P5YHV9_9AGAR|nr:hypothetical protein BDZ94DRAFT_552645 [Collybia nuda]
MSLSRFLATAILRSARPPTLVSCRNITRHKRSFSVTPRLAAIPSNLTAFQAAFQKTTIFRKLANHPEAISALQDLAKALDEAGVDLAGGKQPSTLQMMKLAAKSEFRATIKRVSEEMKKAGVDFGSKEVMDEIMGLKKDIDNK